MAIKNGYRYSAVNGNKMLKDFGNHFLYVSQKPYKGNPEKGLLAGSTVTLQILQDNSEPVVDKKTGQVKEDNRLETFEATIIGAKYPLPFTKGDHVALGDFMMDVSHFIDFDFILRFGSIKKLQPVQMQGQNRQGGKV